jgi:hypothetical protein
VKLVEDHPMPRLKTVLDIFVDALALKAQGVAPHVIADQIVEIGGRNGFVSIRERRSDRGRIIDLFFPDGEVIHYDGTDWHLRRQ